MKFRVATAGLSLLLGGCALPIPIQVASWALEGISVLATKKSLTDHGVSALAQKDCALWRGLTDDEICVDEDGATAVAALSAETDVAEIDPAPLAFVPGGDPALPAKPIAPTAPAPSAEAVAFAPEAPARIETIAIVNPTEHAQYAPVSVVDLPAAGSTAKAAEESDLISTQYGNAKQVFASNTVGDSRGAGGASFYYVIGSFTDRRNADRLAGRHQTLAAAVTPVRLGERMYYRVAVGPFVTGSIEKVRDRLIGAGIDDAWLLRPSDGWTVAETKGPTSRLAPSHGG